MCDQCAEALRGPTPIQRPILATRAPRRALWAVIALSVILTGSVLWGARHRRVDDGVRIEPCALVLTERSGPVCR